MILIVRPTGELGTLLVRKLADQNQPVRAFVRPDSVDQFLQEKLSLPISGQSDYAAALSPVLNQNRGIQ